RAGPARQRGPDRRRSGRCIAQPPRGRERRHAGRGIRARGALAMRRAARDLLLAAAALLASAARAPAPFALPEDRDFHNTTFVGDEPEPARLAFFHAEECLAGARAKEAGREVMKLLRGEATGDVRVGARLVVPVETAALLVLARLPADVR